MTPVSLLLAAIIIIIAPGPPPPEQSPAPQTPATASPAPEQRSPEAGTRGQIPAPGLTRCTKQVAAAAALSEALSSASPGDRICVTANLPDTRLTITKGGGQGQPVTVLGGGKAVVKGIMIKASGVVVDGFQAL